MTFSNLFKAATGFEPYPYQVDFATRHDQPSEATTIHNGSAVRDEAARRLCLKVTYVARSVIAFHNRPRREADETEGGRNE